MAKNDVVELPRLPSNPAHNPYERADLSRVRTYIIDSRVRRLVLSLEAFPVRGAALGSMNFTAAAHLFSFDRALRSTVREQQDGKHDVALTRSASADAFQQVQMTANLDHVPDGISYISLSIMSPNGLESIGQLKVKAGAWLDSNPAAPEPTTIGERVVPNVPGSNAMVIALLVRRGAWWDLHSTSVTILGVTDPADFQQGDVASWLEQNQRVFVISKPLRRRISIAVSAARGLSPRERPLFACFASNSGWCNAKYRMSIVRGTQQLEIGVSSAANGTLDPEWTADEGIGGHTIDRVLQSDTRVVRIELVHYGASSERPRDFLGQADIELSRLWHLAGTASGPDGTTVLCRLGRRPGDTGGADVPITGRVYLHVIVDPEPFDAGL